METTTQSLAMKYVDLNSKLLLDDIKNGYCSDETKEQYAKALELLNSLLYLTISNIKSYDNDAETDADRKRRRSISKTEKLELISIITQL
jgi:replicative DNA helicase